MKTSLRYTQSPSRRASSSAVVCLVVLLAIGGSANGGQDQAGTHTAAQPAANTTEYTFGPGDSLTIKVFGVPELTQTVRVSNSGKIHVAHVGVMRVNGMNAKELARLIAGELRARELVLEPSVHVNVEQYRAHPVYILGEVNQPGQYVLTGKRWFVTDLIGNAEGLGAMADPIAYLYRLKAAAPGQEPPPDESGGFATEDVIKIDLLALGQGKAPDMNVELRGGDVLYVRQGVPEHYYVVGDVNRPGVFEFSYGQGEGVASLRLSQAIAHAGGPARTARPGRGVLVRSGDTGVQEQIRFDFRAVMRGTQPDLLIRANDIVFIPGSNVKTIAYGMLGLIPNLASAAVRPVVK